MKLSTFFTIRSFVALAYALTLLLVPGPLLSLYGITPNPGINLMSQFPGVELIAVGFLCLNARKFTDTAVLRAILTSLLIAEVIGVVIAVYKYPVWCVQPPRLVHCPDLRPVLFGLYLFPVYQAW